MLKNGLNKRGDRRGINHEDINSTKFKKGKSPNPGGLRKDGQPKRSRKPITEALVRQLYEGKISADDIAAAALRHARNNPSWFSAICDRIQGKPKQEISLIDESHALNEQQREEVDERIVSILERARTRYVERRREAGTRELAGATPASD